MAESRTVVTVLNEGAAFPAVGFDRSVLAASFAHVPVNVPAVVTGELAHVTPDGPLMPTLVTVPVPTELGRSAVTKALKVGAAAAPVVGPAKTRLALWVFAAKVMAGAVLELATVVV